MENLYKIRDALMYSLKESETARNGKLIVGELGVLHEITDTIKNIDKICMMEEGEGYSSANRGQHYVRGHYSWDGGMARNRNFDNDYSSRRDSRGRYSRADGRSEMMEHIEMAIDAADGQDKEALKRFMRQLENA